MADPDPASGPLCVVTASRVPCVPTCDVTRAVCGYCLSQGINFSPQVVAMHLHNDVGFTVRVQQFRRETRCTGTHRSDCGYTGPVVPKFFRRRRRVHRVIRQLRRPEPSAVLRATARGAPWMPLDSRLATEIIQKRINKHRYLH
jgi:hypothetical protein